MRTGVQFRGNVSANSSKKWFTHSWPEDWHVTWYVVPTSPDQGQPQIDWDVEVERQSSDELKYFVEIENLTGDDVQIEARYAVLN